MRVILGGVYQSALDAASVRISRAVSDPVPTCTINLRDNTSAIQVVAMQELIVLDDQVIPNPTINLLLNPSLLSPTSVQYAVINPTTSISITGTNPGNQFALANGSAGQAYLSQAALVTVGQMYVFSAYMDITVAFTSGSAFIELLFLDAGSNVLGAGQQTFTTTTPVSSTVRISVQSTAPTGATYAQIRFGANATSTTPSGTVIFTQLQLEPLWFPTISYPTTWCGPAQTNCQQLPQGYWIRQYRKFAGFALKNTAGGYIGNARTLTISAVGYAWLTGIISCNNSYTNKTDSFIIGDLTSTYMTNLVSTTNVITGVTVSNLQSNWDDLRTLFDGLAALSSSYWSIGYYWEFIYAPPGYLAMPISLIADGSGTPDNVTTFPAYSFTADNDYTQPGSQILVIGAGTNVARVIDPATIANNAIVSGYTLPNLTTGGPFFRKVNDSTLNSVTDCTQRGMAELLQYDYPRGIYHLTTNVELLPGESIQVTSNTDGLNKTTLLIQQVAAQWLGTTELLQDEWAYSADLGATNRSATNILSRIHRITQKNTSAPAISATTLAVIENIGVVDSTGTGTTVVNYAQTILADTPVAYYRLSEITGTIADDISGNANQGTTHGSPTLGVATLLTDPADSSDLAMTFASASSQYISLPTTFIPTGSAHAWSIEAWIRIAAIPASGSHAIIAMGNDSNNNLAQLRLVSTGTTALIDFLIFGTDLNSANISINTTYHLAGTYDGTNLRLYINGALSVGPTAATPNLIATYAFIGADGNVAARFFDGTIDECAYYTYALSAGQVSNHYTVGT